MSLPRVARDIMTRNVLTCTDADTISHAHHLMSDKRIRHLPVLSAATGEFIGVITQRELLHYAFSIVARRGISHLDAAEQHDHVGQVMTREVDTISPDLPLSEAGQFFMVAKHGCLPVVVEGKVLGILTSADFVKLSVRLLEQGA